MQRLSFILAVFLLNSSLTYAEELKESDLEAVSLADINGEPSSFINQSVSVITGSYCDQQVDLVIPGPQPLTLQRAYTSADIYNGNLEISWNFNHFEKVGIEKKEDHEEYYYGVQYDAFGTKRIYRGKKRSDGKKICKMEMRPKSLKNGATNCGTGEISGRTNLRNFKMNFQKKSEIMWAKNGSGDEKIYHGISTKGRLGKLIDWNFANGLRTHYEWDENRGKSASLLAPNKTVLSKFTINYPGFKAFQKNPTFTVTANNGQEVVYKFFNAPESSVYTKYAYFLSEVQRPNAPNEKYFYKKNRNRIIRKELPDNRFQEIEYYHSRKNHVAGGIVKIYDEENPRLRRVKRLKAPVGTDQTPIVTHQFKYDIKRHFDRHIDGSTTVYDAYLNRTKYHFTKESRLRKIERFTGDKKLYSSERMYWAKDKSKNATNLLTRGFFDENDRVIFCRNYEYDKYGNVLSDLFYGNFSGNQVEAPTIQSNGTVKGDGCEVHVKNYTYNSNHLVTSEQEGDHKITYTYDGYFVASKLLWDGDEIIFREFYAYDENGVLIEKTCDGGVATSERHIQRITPRHTFPYGLPEIIETLVVDMQTGEELLVKKEVNHHNCVGKIIQTDHYDSNNCFYASEYWDYDSLGNVTLAVDKLGQVTKKKYDANGNLIYEQGPCTEFFTRMTYDFSDRLIREERIHTNGDHFIISHKYDLLGNRIATVDAYGNETTFTYDVFGRLIATQSPLVLDEEGTPYQPITLTDYDHMGNAIRQIDTRGNERKIAYNVRGKATLIEYPDGSFERMVYNIDGTLKQKIARNGTYTLYTYDIKKRVIKEETLSESDTVLKTTTKEYNAFHLLSEVDGNGIQKSYKYDAAGRLIEAIKGESRVCFEYDSRGRISEERNYTSETEFIVKRFEYDLLDRVIAEWGADEDRTTYTTYDALGNKKDIIIGDSITTTRYNSYGQLIEAIDALGNSTVTHFDYGYHNALGQNVAYCEVIDSLGNVTVKISDALGRDVEVSKRNPLGDVTQKRCSFYDGADNCVRIVETVVTPEAVDRVVTTRFEYDDEDRQTSIIEAYGTPEQKVTAMTYNYSGEKECIIKPDGVEIYHTYDSLGRLQRLTSSDGSIDYGYTYDQNSNPLTLTDHYTDSVTSRVYDSHNRLVSETMGNGLTVQFAYDAGGRPVKVTLPDQSAIAYAYDGTDLTSVTRIKNGTERYQHRYTQFDSAGRITEAESPVGTFKFSHDLNGRIKTIHSPFWNMNAIEYDAEGNLTSQVIVDSEGETNNGFIYDDLYQIKQESGAFSHSYNHDSVYNRIQKDENGYILNALNQLLDDGIHTFSYDINGCLVKKNAIEYSYDALNRLTNVGGVTYTYDSENRRLSKTVGGKKIRYLYHGKNEIGSCDESGKIIELRVLGTGKGAEIGAAVALEFDDVTYYPIHDQNGNVACIVSTKGKVVESYRYSAFGEEEVFGTESSINPWRFASKRFDEETGTLFFGRRSYDPQTGRWITPDPMGLSAGPNLYAYVNNSPLTNIDLYGLFLQSMLSFIGSSIQMVGDHLVPIYGLGIGISFTGYMIENGTFSGFQHSSQYPHSSNDSLHRAEASPYVRMVVVNGIMTPIDEAKANALAISAMHGNWNVHYCHNATHGFLSDLLECLAQVIGISTNSDRMLTQLLKEQISDMGGVDNGGKVNVYAHSQGGLVLYRAMQNLSPEERKMLNVVTLGSAKMISSEGLAGAINYISTWDGVPCLDPVGLLKGKCSNNMNIVHLSSSFTYPCGDHFLKHKNYWGVLEQAGDDFKAIYGVAR